MLPARVAALLALGLCATAAEKTVPPIWPQVQGTFPRGGQQGTEVEITIQGRNLQDTKGVTFRSPKLHGEIIQSGPYEVKARITIAADAEPGRHDLRLVCSHGSAISYFDVGVYPERLESEPNNDRAKAETLRFPAVVNGILKQGDYDYFKFDATEGQMLLFDVLGTRNGASTDAVLSLLNESGEELAYSDDYYGFKDPHLVHRFEKAGTYFLRVYGSSEAGCETCDYRLLAGPVPHADFAMPGGGTRGKTVEFSLRGVNLDSVSSVTLGDGVATGKVIRSKPDEARIALALPESLPPGEMKLHYGGMLAVPFMVSEVPEVTVSDGSARSRKDPLPVRLPVVANGVLDQPRAADHFIFTVDEPRTVVLETHAMQLGFLTDPLVAIYDEKGTRLAYQDDPTTNTGKEPANMDPHLVFRLPKPGRYVAMVRDAQFRGDPAFFYRLSIRYAEPDFSLRTIGTSETLYRGRTNRLLVRVRRLEGWNAPVEVWAENLPLGVRAKPVVADAKNTPYTGTCGETHYLDGTNIEFEILVDRDAPLSAAGIRFRGRGVQDGRTVERSSRARYFKSRIRHIGDAEEDDLAITIADAPGAVLGVPQTVALKEDGSASFTTIVTRLDESSDPLELTIESAADGLSAPAVAVPASSTRAEVKLKAVEKASGEFAIVARANGVVIGRSHPIRLRSKS